MSDTPTFVSSIVEVSTAAAVDDAAVTLTDLSHLTKMVVKVTPGRSGGLGPAFGTSEVVGEAMVCGSRPGEWLVFGDADAVAAVVDGADGHVVDLTHGRLMIEIAGTAATGTLEKVCSLDWDDRMMPDGAVTSASVAKVSCDVIRSDRDGAPAYLIAADRSFGQYLYDALVDAAAEFVV